jgi:cytochrome c-type biogenesis protein CcmH/NrfG
MANEPTTVSNGSSRLRTAHVCVIAAVCLATGLAIGYLTGGSPSAASARTMAPTVEAPRAGQGAVNSGHGANHVPSLDEMKRVADKQAAPLLEKLKTDPNNTTLLVQAGDVYYRSHQFGDATTYYDRAVKADPRNVALRTKLSSSLYRNGDSDGAIAELNRALRYDPKDANSLFNLGTIRLQGKGDGRGALAAWQQLLKSNPELSPDRKAAVQKLMADVMTTLGNQRGTEGARKQ